ncbi:EF-P lysine aminoacylase GenX [Pseudorhizobium endolithicum]|uniref:EF-P lysine aminoacylase GenX n=1 Tax=Pseudorhizobium endolithicum TaxID=1191678 RepID=A0ABN7JVL5_9HYPH|nr:EF-P lysine aminoacylase EpmA [Pseudorhizobium endolithicum]CAD7050476.1 EF-P lysine aminoacylase GenX [Pseudorhizobium endolithicum]
MQRSASTSSRSPWWEPSVHADRRPLLMARNRIRSRLRRHFDEQDFVEVDPAALQISPGNETHLHAFETQALTTDGRPSPLFLHTSPEFACKKLLAAGEPRLYSFSHVYRNRERGPLHHPEFTMLEWYRAGADYRMLMEDCSEILALAAEAAETNRFSYRGATIDPFAEPEIVTLAEAFDRFAGIDLLASISSDRETDREHLAAELGHSGIRFADDDSWADLFSRVLVEKIEPNLGRDRATILCEYPVAEAALARPSPRDPRVAERFELYACGVELANAFGELTDPAEQRRRFEHEMAEKARIYGDSYPIDEDFLSALEIIPEASGAALGFDRLVMLVTGASRIDLVMWAPVAEQAP